MPFNDFFLWSVTGSFSISRGSPVYFHIRCFDGEAKRIAAEIAQDATYANYEVAGCIAHLLQTLQCALIAL